MIGNLVKYKGCVSISIRGFLSKLNIMNYLRFSTKCKLNFFTRTVSEYMKRYKYSVTLNDDIWIKPLVFL